MTMPDYQPTEDEVTHVLNQYTPRQLAFGYLRAVKRNKAAIAELEIMRSLGDLEATLKARVK